MYSFYFKDEDSGVPPSHKAIGHCVQQPLALSLSPLLPIVPCTHSVWFLCLSLCPCCRFPYLQGDSPQGRVVPGSPRGRPGRALCRRGFQCGHCPLLCENTLFVQNSILLTTSQVTKWFPMPHLFKEKYIFFNQNILNRKNNFSFYRESDHSFPSIRVLSSTVPQDCSGAAAAPGVPQLYSLGNLFPGAALPLGVSVYGFWSVSRPVRVPTAAVGAQSRGSFCPIELLSVILGEAA